MPLFNSYCQSINRIVLFDVDCKQLKLHDRDDMFLIPHIIICVKRYCKIGTIDTSSSTCSNMNTKWIEHYVDVIGNKYLMYSQLSYVDMTSLSRTLSLTFLMQTAFRGFFFSKNILIKEKCHLSFADMDTIWILLINNN